LSAACSVRSAALFSPRSAVDWPDPGSSLPSATRLRSRTRTNGWRVPRKNADCSAPWSVREPVAVGYGDGRRRRHDLFQIGRPRRAIARCQAAQHAESPETAVKGGGGRRCWRRCRWRLAPPENWVRARARGGGSQAARGKVWTSCERKRKTSIRKWTRAASPTQSRRPRS
jgi:hypothetical protein